MKKSLMYSDVENLAIFEPFVNRLAEMRAKSTLKFLEQRTGMYNVSDTVDTLKSVSTNNIISDLRSDVTTDCAYIERFKNVTNDKEGRTELKRDNLRDEMRLNTLEMSNIKAQMKREYDERELEKLNERLAELEADNVRIAHEISVISAYLAQIQPIISDTFTDGYDLVNDAQVAIRKALKRSENAHIIFERIAFYNKMGLKYNGMMNAVDMLNISISEVIVAKKKLKTKDGYKYYTLATFADKLIRNDVNFHRSGTASRTTHYLRGVDEEGNDIYIQSDKFSTAGGLDTIYRNDEFNDFIKTTLELTPIQKDLVWQLWKGKTQEEIARHYNVSQQAISKRIVALKEQIANAENVAQSYACVRVWKEKH